MLTLSLTTYSNDIRLFPGYYISQAGDTIHCQIEFNDWNRNPKTIQVQLNNALKEFGPEDIRGFGITGYGDYMSVSVSYHTDPIAGSNLPGDFSDKMDKGFVYLKILEKGVYSLYELITPERVCYFMSYPDNPVSELIYRVKEENDTLSADDHYKKELFPLFVKEGISTKYFNRVNNVPYNGSALASLFEILNKNRTGSITSKKSSGDFQLEPFVGVVRSSFPTAFNGNDTKMSQFGPIYSFSGGINFLYSIPGNFKAFKLGLSISYLGYKSEMTQSGVNQYSTGPNNYGTTTYTEHLTIINSSLRISPYFMYVIDPLHKIQFYLKAGLNYNTSFGSNINLNSRDTSTTTGVMNGNVPVYIAEAGTHKLATIKQNYISFLASGGIIVGRSRFEISWSPSVNIANPSGDPSDPSLDNFKIASTAVYYYFSLFPGKKRASVN